LTINGETYDGRVGSINGAVDRWKLRARSVKRETFALYLAARDARVPWYAKLLGICVVGYAFSPIDLIPDYIPILGYVDDLLLVPFGIALVVKMIPPEVMTECREKAEDAMARGKPTNWVAAGVIVAVWFLLLALSAVLVLRILRN
jgi:uncharacterized membrane protein YkvA (DUF1232 family)